ncbi:MAG: hypothetical protein EBS49_00940 [Verrucomicrobia bacterium]|nr:hypothetical protein [Verrucomicrobiota bacterium]NBU68193.1 hypothetical protein [Verrucomicrobiota bacterium]
MASDQSDSFQIGAFQVRENPSNLTLADKLNRIREAIDQVRLQPGPGYTLSRTRGGTTIQILSRQGSSALSESCPFDVSVEASGSSYKIKVLPGTLNGLMAVNYADCLSYESTTLSVATSGSTNVVLDVTTDGKQVTSFTLATQATVTAMSPTTPLAPTGFKWPVAHVKNGVVYKTIGCGSLQASVKENVRVAKAPATPDDNAYDIYYYWTLSSL